MSYSFNNYVDQCQDGQDSNEISQEKQGKKHIKGVQSMIYQPIYTNEELVDRKSFELSS